jgi:hypothetical protein
LFLDFLWERWTPTSFDIASESEGFSNIVPDSSKEMTTNHTVFLGAVEQKQLSFFRDYLRAFPMNWPDPNPHEVLSVKDAAKKKRKLKITANQLRYAVNSVTGNQQERTKDLLKDHQFLARHRKLLNPSNEYVNREWVGRNQGRVQAYLFFLIHQHSLLPRDVVVAAQALVNLITQLFDFLCALFMSDLFNSTLTLIISLRNLSSASTTNSMMMMMIMEMTRTWLMTSSINNSNRWT